MNTFELRMKSKVKLAEENERLRAALKPFADHPDFHAHHSWAVTYIDDAHEIPGVTAGDFQRAKAAMTHNV
jgi:hypothetical protein